MVFISRGCISQQLIKTGKLLGRRCWGALWGWDISGSSLILNLDESNPWFSFSPWVESSTGKLLKGGGMGGRKGFQLWDPGWLDVWGKSFELCQKRFGLDIRRNFSMEKVVCWLELAAQGRGGVTSMEMFKKHEDWGHGLVVNMVLGWWLDLSFPTLWIPCFFNFLQKHEPVVQTSWSGSTNTPLL